MIRQSTVDSPKVNRFISPQRLRLNRHYQAVLEKLRESCQSSDSEAFSLGVTSSTSGEGVSCVAAELAISCAQLGRTLLIDGNINMPSCNKTFKLSQGTGLSNVVLQGVPLCECIEESQVDNLSILTSGTCGNSSDLMSHRDNLAGVFDSVRHDYRFLVCDIPAVAEAGDLCTFLTQCVNGTVFVVEAERNSGNAILQAKENLEHAEANLLGVVFNKQPQYLPQWLDKLL